MAWTELAASNFAPAAGGVPAPGYWCAPWSKAGKEHAPDAPKMYFLNGNTYTIHVPNGQHATEMEIRLIGYRQHNWINDMIDTYINGPFYSEDNKVTFSEEWSSDTGTCMSATYKYAFSARSNVTLRLVDRKGDAKFVGTHVLLKVDGAPVTTSTFVASPPLPPTSTGNTPGGTETDGPGSASHPTPVGSISGSSSISSPPVPSDTVTGTTTDAPVGTDKPDACPRRGGAASILVVMLGLLGVAALL